MPNMDERLDFKIQLPKQLYECKVLCFLTQPFVENAIKHGMKSNPYGEIEINVEASKINDYLLICIGPNLDLQTL
jgi:sensor histidine kinase YesM